MRLLSVPFTAVAYNTMYKKFDIINKYFLQWIIIIISLKINENTFMKRSRSASGNIPASFSLLASSLNRSIINYIMKN
jgi:hypothetical protein